MRFVVIVLVCALPLLSLGNETLSSKVVRLPLNQNEPAAIKLGTHGITTLEFPYKIEALDGYGFSASPAPDSTDGFQISFNKGTNFLSLKAMHEGVEGNLMVVLDGRVYSLFCMAVAEPSFVVVFEDNSARVISAPRDVSGKNKPVSTARLLGFLDKVKGYPSLKVSAPEIFQNMEVAEPNSESSLDGLKVTLGRVIRDESIDALGFEVELVNQSKKKFFYDPESFGVRVGDEVYPAAISEAEGIVEAGKTLPAFFVVAGTATGSRNDLAVTNKFDIVMRQITGEPDRKISTQRPEPPEAVSSAQRSSEEPALPSAEEGQASNRLSVTGPQNPRKPHGRRKKSPAAEASYAAQPKEQERREETAPDVDE
jgi:hypothetical protein